MKCSRHVLAVGMVTAIGVASHCGPSLQTLYRGDAEFEHCYALDERPTAALQEKARCWHEWTQYYTYGQTHDRVVYADARYHALSRIPRIPTDEALMLAAPGEGSPAAGKAVSAPIPASAFVPPPHILTSPDGGHL